MYPNRLESTIRINESLFLTSGACGVRTAEWGGRSDVGQLIFAHGRKLFNLLNTCTSNGGACPLRGRAAATGQGLHISKEQHR